MIDNIRCTGCSACISTCPVNAIEMKIDINGFRYPYIKEERCIHCGKCDKVCPSVNHMSGLTNIEKQSAYIAVSKDNSIRLASSSGGAFTEICRSYGSDNLVVFGATFSMEGVEHTYIEGLEKLSLLRKSKYIQSDMKDMYQKAKECLEQGKKVVFSGTPCQIAGLRNYCGREYDNLLCIDLVCHGVGSWQVFHECMNYAEREYKSQIVNYSFRAKKKYRSGANERHTSEYLMKDGKRVLIEKDRYSQLFLNQLCIRQCCGETCLYRTRDRQGDITISDFKNHKEVMKPSKYIKTDYSTIIVNNIKGMRAIKNLSKYMEMIPISMDEVLEDNPIFASSGQSNNLREVFWEDWKTLGAEKTIDKWTCKQKFTWKERIIRLIPVRIFVWYYKAQNR